jgi:hypothetical protein
MFNSCIARWTNSVALGSHCNLKPRNAKELEGLVRSATERLKDAGNTSLALESRFDLAYNAAHSLSLAALRRLGCRASNRYIVFQVCATHTEPWP